MNLNVAIQRMENVAHLVAMTLVREYERIPLDNSTGLPDFLAFCWSSGSSTISTKFQPSFHLIEMTEQYVMKRRPRRKYGNISSHAQTRWAYATVSLVPESKFTWVVSSDLFWRKIYVFNSSEAAQNQIDTFSTESYEYAIEPLSNIRLMIREIALENR